MTRPEREAGVADVDLSGEAILVTGSTDGVGRETALALDRLGATVLVHGRSRRKGREVVERMDGGAFFPADFASLAAVRDLADAVREQVGDLDALVNNAGGHFRKGELTEDGIERTMTVNHFAPFLLTNLLLPEMPPGSRVVTVASGVHRRDEFDFERFTSVEGYGGFDAYGRSKLANILFTRELARRAEGVTSNCLHPGFVPGSSLWRDASLPIRGFMAALRALPDAVTRVLAETPATAARTPVYLAASPEVADVTGEYFADCEPVEPAPLARDDDLARRLWEESAELTGLADGS